MGAGVNDLQAFLFRSLGVNRALGPEEDSSDTGNSSFVISSFSAVDRERARFMGEVYELLYCLENSIRELIRSVLVDAFGASDWWSKGVDEAIRKGAEKRRMDDAKARWHSPRGGSVLSYVDFPQYAGIIQANWSLFEPLLGDDSWVSHYFEELNRTRRALAHTGQLTVADVERMEVRVKDWLRVVG